MLGLVWHGSSILPKSASLMCYSGFTWKAIKNHSEPIWSLVTFQFILPWLLLVYPDSSKDLVTLSCKSVTLSFLFPRKPHPSSTKFRGIKAILVQWPSLKIHQYIQLSSLSYQRFPGQTPALVLRKHMLLTTETIIHRAGHVSGALKTSTLPRSYSAL